MPVIDEATVDAVVTAVKQSRKYRDTHEATIRMLAIEAVAQHKRAKPAEKAVRKRLHSIMAPYLGDPDYDVAARRLTAAFAGGDDDAIQAVVRRHHVRAPVHAGTAAHPRHVSIATFSPSPATRDRLLDIGSGLNPLALRWMDLPSRAEYLAYDIHEPRVAFLNHYFRTGRIAASGRSIRMWPCTCRRSPAMWPCF